MRLLSGTLTRPKVSQRQTRRVLAEQVVTQQTMERVLLAFLSMSFWRRMKWLLTGKV